MKNESQSHALNFGSDHQHRTNNEGNIVSNEFEHPEYFCSFGDWLNRNIAFLLIDVPAENAM